MTDTLPIIDTAPELAQNSNQCCTSSTQCCNPTFYTVKIVFTNGYVSECQKCSMESYEKLMDILTDSNVGSFNLNNQYFNKMAIATVFTEEENG